jgi:hypothetical protein
MLPKVDKAWSEVYGSPETKWYEIYYTEDTAEPNQVQMIF